MWRSNCGTIEARLHNQYAKVKLIVVSSVLSYLSTLTFDLDQQTRTGRGQRPHVARKQDPPFERKMKMFILCLLTITTPQESGLLLAI